MAQNTSTKRKMVTVRLLGEPKKTKKKERRKEGSKKDTQYSGKLDIRPDHLCRRIEIEVKFWLCVDVAQSSVKFHEIC